MLGRARRRSRSRTTSASIGLVNRPSKPSRRSLKKPKTILSSQLESTRTLPEVRRFSTDDQVPKDLKLGLPTREQYTRIEQEYLNALSLRKREKALLTQDMFDDIWDVMHNPRESKIRTPQFRFWVRKMFVLAYVHPDAASSNGNIGGEEDLQPVIMHENRPVALKEQIYNIVSYCHRVSDHGGRDRTMALVRERYSWIPKELIAQFVKICPTCVYKRTKDTALALSLRGLLPEEDAVNADSALSDDLPGVPLASDYRRIKTSNSGSDNVLHDWSVSMNTQPSEDVLSRPSTRRARPTMRDTLCLPPLMPRTGSSSSSGSGSGYGYDVPAFSDSCSVPAQSESWLASLASLPGPNTPAHTRVLTNTLAPIHTPMRRVGSEGDADPFRAPTTRVTLPPLMKALSEGACVEPRRVPEMFSIPRYEGPRTSESSAEYPGLVDGDDQPVAMDVDVDIDPALLHEHHIVTQSYFRSDAPAVSCAFPHNVSFAPEMRPAAAAEYVDLPPSRTIVTATPVKLPHRVLIRSDSGSILDAHFPVYTGPVNAEAAVMLPVHVQMHSAPVDDVFGPPSSGSSKSVACVSGGEGERSFDEQDWEIRYCLDDSPP